MLPGDIAPAFASAVPRFYSNDNGLPGSGQYDEQDNYSLASTVNKKLVSRSGAFGSAASRFRESAATATAHATGAIDLSPGPTSYDPDAGSKARKSSSMFQSKTRRFPVRSAPPGGGQAGRKGEEVPLMDSNTPKYDPTAIGPGTYVLEDTWSANAIKRRSRRQGNVFISQQDRFGGPLPPGAPKSITPGPGRYSHTRERDAFKPFVRQLPGTGFSTQSRRFKASTTVSPGPGSYEASDPNSDMLKRSFNVTVDELGFY